MNGFHHYLWQGVPIQDIKAWARERGEQMVVVNWHHKEPNPYGNNYIEWDEEIECPETFFDAMRFNTLSTGVPSVIRKYAP